MLQKEVGGRQGRKNGNNENAKKGHSIIKEGANEDAKVCKI